jgi:hypothetical protein
MSEDSTERIRVGIIGANPDRGWAAQAHIPALKSLPDDFEITALSTTRREPADATLYGSGYGLRDRQDRQERLLRLPFSDHTVEPIYQGRHVVKFSRATSTRGDFYTSPQNDSRSHIAVNPTLLATPRLRDGLSWRWNSIPHDAKSHSSLLLMHQIGSKKRCFTQCGITLHRCAHCMKQSLSVLAL